MPYDVQRKMAMLLPPHDAKAIALTCKSAVELGRYVALLSSDNVIICMKGWKLRPTFNISDPTSQPLLRDDSLTPQHRNLTLVLHHRDGMLFNDATIPLSERLDCVKRLLTEVMTYSPFTSLTIKCDTAAINGLHQLQILDSLPALHALTFKYPSIRPAPHMVFRVEGLYPTVKVMKLSCCRVDAQNLVRTFPALEMLDMKECEVVSSVSLRDLGCLTDLRLFKTDEFMNRDAGLFSSLGTLTNLTALQVLCYNTRLSEAIEICINLLHLKSLTLEVAAPLSGDDTCREACRALSHSIKPHTLSISFSPQQSCENGEIDLWGKWSSVKVLSVDPFTAYTGMPENLTHMQIIGDVRRTPTIHSHMPKNITHQKIPLHCLAEATHCINLETLVCSFGYCGEWSDADNENFDFMKEVERKDEDELWWGAVDGGCFGLLRTVCFHPGLQDLKCFPSSAANCRLAESFCRKSAALLSLLANPKCKIDQVIFTQLVKGEYGVIQSLCRMPKLSTVILINMHLTTVDVLRLVQLRVMTRIELLGCTLTGEENRRHVWMSSKGRKVLVMQRSWDKVKLV